MKSIAKIMNCTHPDHTETETCIDRAIGCHTHCQCCLGASAASDFILDGELAKQLAECFNWPAKEPVFTFTRDRDNQLYGGYDAGLDYEVDGYTFEWEFRIKNPRITTF